MGLRTPEGPTVSWQHEGRHVCQPCQVVLIFFRKIMCYDSFPREFHRGHPGSRPRSHLKQLRAFYIFVQKYFLFKNILVHKNTIPIFHLCQFPRVENVSYFFWPGFSSDIIYFERGFYTIRARELEYFMRLDTDRSILDVIYVLSVLLPTKCCWFYEVLNL